MARRHSIHDHDPRARSKERNHQFGMIVDLVGATQYHLDDETHAIRRELTQQIGGMIHRWFTKEGWDADVLVDLSRHLIGRGAALDLFSPENLERMRQLAELEQRLVVDTPWPVIAPIPDPTRYDDDLLSSDEDAAFLRLLEGGGDSPIAS
jgi:hypothetical protein